MDFLNLLRKSMDFTSKSMDFTSKNMNFTGKVVLVTGASAGIGKATAELFAKLGATLALVGRNEENLMKVADRCRGARGAEVLPIVADLRTNAGCELTAKRFIEKFGRLDVVVNNPGIGASTKLQYAEIANFDRLFDTNVQAVYNLTPLLVPALTEARGNIVNISSVKGSHQYFLTKEATKSVSLKLTPHGVRVNTVSPSVWSFAITFAAHIDGLSPEQYKDFLEQEYRFPLGLGTFNPAEDVARAVALLASDHSRDVNGVTNWMCYGSSER